MAGGSSRRARRRRRHARWGKPVYRRKPQTRGLPADLVIVDEAQELISADPGSFTGLALSLRTEPAAWVFEGPEPGGVSFRPVFEKLHG